MENTQTKVRNSNFEILRIISMVLIVMQHYACHGFSVSELTYSPNRYIVGVLILGGKLGVSCFVLISGYFMVNSKITARKLIKLIAQTWFYSVGLCILFKCVITPGESMGIRAVIKEMVPIGTGKYWFITDYFMLMLMSPVLNLLIENMGRTMHRNIIIVATVLWSVIPIFLASATYAYTEIVWFVVLYILAAYIRKYVDMEKKNAKKHFRGGIVSYLIVILLNIFLIYMRHITGNYYFYTWSIRLMLLNSPFILASSVELLIGFAKMKPVYNKVLNKFASATLGVYLIHENSYVKPYLWNTLLKNSQMYESSFLIVHALVSIIAVYLVCVLIDLIRQCTVERLFMNFVDKHLEQAESKVLAICKSCAKKVNAVVMWYYK